VNDGYCLDASSLIHGWRRAYPIPHFQPVWDRIEQLIEAGRLISSAEVLDELAQRSDDLYAWAKERKEIFINVRGHDAQDCLAGILERHQGLAGVRKGRSVADPFVIAVAKVYDPPLVVVSQEEGSDHIQKKPKIPSVCKAEGLECIKLLDLIIREDWRF